MKLNKNFKTNDNIYDNNNLALYYFNLYERLTETKIKRK